MSVLIKGMKIPESCCVCPVNMERCNYGYEYLRDHPELYERRAGNCPIVEVPTPHGRLIDADEIGTSWDEWYDDDDGWQAMEYYDIETVMEAPTIIEAEE